MARIFISYRRADSAGWAGRISDRLKEKLRNHEVFLDVESIGLGDDYTVAVDKFLGACSVVLVIIGDDWISIRDSKGNRRIDDPQDLVRLEVGHALRSDAKVVPLQIDGALMPSRAELPEDLALLANRQSLEVRTTSFERDVDHLANQLAVLLGGPAVAAAAPTPSPVVEIEPARYRGSTRKLVIGATAVAGAVALGLALWIGGVGSDGDREPVSLETLSLICPIGFKGCNLYNLCTSCYETCTYCQNQDAPTCGPKDCMECKEGYRLKQIYGDGTGSCIPE